VKNHALQRSNFISTKIKSLHASCN